jgi:hypothetical protein
MTRHPTPVKVFVAASGNEFMSDLATWITESCASSGRDTALVKDSLPRADGFVNLVVAPHEFFELFDAPAEQLQRAASVSVCVTTEQPGTPWFDLTVDVCRRAQYTLDINHHGVEALRELGIDAGYLQVGSVNSMVAARDLPDVSENRPIDVLFMGGLDERRGQALARLAPRLATRRADLRLFPFDRPVSSTTPGVVFGPAKYELLASAKLLVNIHRDRSGPAGPHYFEWARVIEAMSNGCVVVSEPSDQHGPLRAGTDFISVDLDGMSDAIDQLLDNFADRQRLAASAFDAATKSLALDQTVPALLDDLEGQRKIGPSAPMTADPTQGRWTLGASTGPHPIRLGPFQPVAELQKSAKRIALADTALLRRIDQTDCLLRHGATQHIDLIATPAHTAGPAPRVSAIVTLYNYAEVVTDALSSLAGSVDVDFEIVIVDDHSTDDGRTVVEQFLREHPQVPMLLLGKQANEGLAHARNDAIAAATGDYVFVMDADNEVYPQCLSRLSETLDQNEDVAAAYSILEDFGESQGVRSAFPWEPQRLCTANYIDAQAMWRRTTLESLGGYRFDDEFVYGWEDWDLWLQLAASGGRALLLREILGRYRVQASSMISLTNLATNEAVDALRHRYPSLPWPGTADNATATIGQ